MLAVMTKTLVFMRLVVEVILQLSRDVISSEQSRQ